MVYNGYYKVMSNSPKSWDIYQSLCQDTGHGKNCGVARTKRALLSSARHRSRASQRHFLLAYRSKFKGNQKPFGIWVCLKMLCTTLNPMVLLIIIPIKWLFHWEYTLFSDIPIYQRETMWVCLKMLG